MADIFQITIPAHTVGQHYDYYTASRPSLRQSLLRFLPGVLGGRRGTDRVWLGFSFERIIRGALLSQGYLGDDWDKPHQELSPRNAANLKLSVCDTGSPNPFVSWVCPRAEPTGDAR